MLNDRFRRAYGLAVLCFAAVGVLSAVTLVRAQGPTLAEVAKKEQDRRKTQKPTGKVYTNKDLPAPAAGRPAGGEQGATAQGAAQAPASALEAKPADKPAGQDDEKDEAWWRKRIAAAREELRRNEMFAEALQSRINSLSADFASRDDPFQRAKLGEDRDRALAELARVKQAIGEGKQQIDGIEEEARKAGVPPGWLR